MSVEAGNPVVTVSIDSAKGELVGIGALLGREVARLTMPIDRESRDLSDDVAALTSRLMDAIMVVANSPKAGVALLGHDISESVLKAIASPKPGEPLAVSVPTPTTPVHVWALLVDGCSVQDTAAGRLALIELPPNCVIVHPQPGQSTAEQLAGIDERHAKRDEMLKRFRG